ncbi:MAG: alpha/beta fold hydrolase [Candidatus Acidiferrales bacterium]|jgi:predicted alpha/beta-fold hydrolase
MRPFEPHPLLRNAHAMTIVAAFLRRRYPDLSPAEAREFEVAPGIRLLGLVHWQPARRERPALVLVHGLEGSSESGNMLGLAEKAFRAGFSVVRMNQRNCGASERLSPTLYNSGLSGDYRAVLNELVQQDGVPEIFFAGYSMGGNLVMKMAGELGADAPPEFRALAVVCPALDLSACSDALSESRNFIYQRHFVRNLQARTLRKARVFPGTIRVEGLARVRTVREFDDAIIAPQFGFRDAEDYYQRSSALRVIDRVRVPALILTAKDDPVVPYHTLDVPAIRENPNVTLEAPAHGGHCGFISRWNGPERFWGEARVLEFFRRHHQVAAGWLAG